MITKIIDSIICVALILLIHSERLAAEGTHDHGDEMQDLQQHDESAPKLWTCPMNPKIQETKPGSCPICKMDLVPADSQEKKVEEAKIDKELHSHSRPDEIDVEKDKQASEEPDFWTCSMHPQIKLPEFGQCPICKMDLIPVHRQQGDSGIPTLKLSESAQQLAGIQTVKIKRKLAEKEIRLVGKVDFDETRLKHITARVPGRIERLFVDYTGITVQKGDHLVELYSPDLVAAQEELIQAARAMGRISGSSSSVVRRSSEKSLRAVREKLILWGLTEEQVVEIERKKVPSDRLTIYASVGGVVTVRSATEGMYVQTGTRIYSIADLSQVWVNLEAYESDLPWIRYGQKVEFSTRSLPGQVFKGAVSFIHPFLKEKSRTTTVRVVVDNSDGRLKPGVFVTGYIKAQVFSKGRVLDTALQGKWICPMHQEVVQDQLEQCPVCGMDLVKAESLGFFTDQSEVEPSLVVPASSLLITGERAIVYLKRPGSNSFEQREVILGPSAGDYYIVESGVKEGDEVVSSGAFKIDSDLQIKGFPSMMNPSGESTVHEHNH